MTMLVVAAALRDGAGRYLMQRRPEGKAHAGLWEFPGGKVEPGESAVAALLRELAEECALVLDPADVRPLTFAADDRVTLLLFGATVDPAAVTCVEAAALCWDRLDVLTRLPMPPLDAVLLARLRDEQHR